MRRSLALSLWLWAWAAGELRAQWRPDHAPRVATLAVWADDIWLALTDRDGSYFGRLADEGTLQRFNPLMDSEYELDLRTGLFTPSEDARWAVAPSGLRVAGASINHPFVLNFFDWRQAMPVSGPVGLIARYVRQRSLTARRDHARLGVEWRDALASSWTLRSTIGTHFFKASADIEFGAARTWARHGRGSWTVDLRFAVLDAFNNFIFNTLGVRATDTPAHFDYAKLPFALRASVVRTSRAFRFEIHGGATTRSEVAVSFPASGDPGYVLVEQVGFIGALGEAALSRRVAVAVYGTAARALTDRRFTLTTADDLDLREDTGTLGLRGRVKLGATLGLDVDLAARWQPESRGIGGGAVGRDSDRELFGRIAVERHPLRGWTWRLSYAVLDRDSEVLRRLTATNHRHVMEGGYRFSSGFEVTAGLRWDLDEGLRAPFDGGHLRFAAALP